MSEELHQRCKLPQLLDLLSRRQLNFFAKLFARPTCMVARRMLFAIIYTQPGENSRIVSGREHSSYLKVLASELKYMYSPLLVGRSLNDFLTESWRNDLAKTKALLMAPNPDTPRGCKGPLQGCVAHFAEKKELNRHIRRFHPLLAANMLADPAGNLQP